MTGPPTEEPIEVILEDGGQVIVSFADEAARSGDGGVEIATALISAKGSEDDLGRQIRAEAEVHGLRCTVSGSRHPTRVVVGSGALDVRTEDPPGS
jgi:hypothetical protein